MLLFIAVVAPSPSLIACTPPVGGLLFTLVDGASAALRFQANIPPVVEDCGSLSRIGFQYSSMHGT